MSQFTLALNKSVLTQLLQAAESGFYTVVNDTKTSGAFTASYDIGVKLQGGTFTLSPGNIDIDNVNVVNDPSTFGLTIQLPNFCTPSFTIPIINVTVPSVCVFSSPPQIHLDLDLKNYLDIKVSVHAGAVLQHFNNPAWLPALSNMDAYKAHALNAWHIFAHPSSVDVTIHITGSLAVAFATAVQNAFNNLISPLPGWAKAIVIAIVGPVVVFIEAILGITGAVGDFILGLLTTLFNLASVLQTPIAQYFASKYFFSLSDPVPIPFKDPAIPPVVPAPTPPVDWNPLFIFIRNPALAISSDELVVSADIA
jgi:hypothetical protein